MNMKRMRGRNHRQGGGGGGGGGGFRNQQNGIPLNRNHVFDSSGPEMRVRGTAQQLFDKYTQMARDAASSGDRVLGEAYYQHAEHYFRIISAINQAQGLPNPPQNGQQGGYAQGGEGESGEQPRQENRPDTRQDVRQEPRQDQNRQEFRQDRPERQDRQENRQDNRPDNRENRNEGRDNRQDRRFDQRPRPEFQQRDRGDRPFRQPQPPIAEAPIDISSALEAELSAAVAEPPGLSEQPMIQHELMMPAPAPEPRAIPISIEAPPPPAEEPAAPAKRPRGRPRVAKVETETPSE
jgi:hypothetical protein